MRLDLRLELRSDIRLIDVSRLDQRDARAGLRGDDEDHGRDVLADALPIIWVRFEYETLARIPSDEIVRPRTHRVTLHPEVNLPGPVDRRVRRIPASMANHIVLRQDVGRVETREHLEERGVSIPEVKRNVPSLDGDRIRDDGGIGTAARERIDQERPLSEGARRIHCQEPFE